MAGDWIKMRTNLDTDPAVVRISSALQQDRFSVVGRLHRIWSWANEHLSDGQDVPVDAAFLDSLVETPGFAAAMRNVNWLSGRDGSLCFPGFERHNGESAKKRAQDAERKKRARTSVKCPPEKRTECGPEKRREEKSKNELPIGNSCAEQDAPAPDTGSGFVFALKGGKPWHLSDKKLAEYVATYPMDVQRELLKAAQWLRDNSHRRPASSSGILKFLTRWLNRAHDRSNGRPGQQGGKISMDDKLMGEMARARRIREERRTNAVPPQESTGVQA